MINIILLEKSLPKLLEGFLVSFKISFISFFIGIIIGTIIAFCSISNNRIVNFFSSLYTLFFRGTPMIIQILLLFFLFQSLQLPINSFYSAIIAIGLNSSAYIGETIKAGIQSVSKGEIEAAKNLGLTEFQINRYIVFPQAIKNIFPALGNECITLFKDSSLSHIIGIAELTYQGNIIIGATYDAITIYFGVALFYLIGTSLLTLLLKFYEKRYKCN